MFVRNDPLLGLESSREEKCRKKTISEKQTNKQINEAKQNKHNISPTKNRGLLGCGVVDEPPKKEHASVQSGDTLGQRLRDGGHFCVFFRNGSGSLARVTPLVLCDLNISYWFSAFTMYWTNVLELSIGRNSGVGALRGGAGGEGTRLILFASDSSLFCWLVLPGAQSLYRARGLARKVAMLSFFLCVISSC